MSQTHHINNYFSKIGHEDYNMFIEEIKNRKASVII